jgi:undecaprenol kinase/diacylglycerol kinase (ATP)
MLFKEEHNSRIHFFVAICVIIAGFVFKVTLYEWMALVFAVGFVIAMEIVNTVIENISDFVSPEKNERIKKIKDLSAAGVLISALTALIIGLIVFIPEIILLF